MNKDRKNPREKRSGITIGYNTLTVASMAAIIVLSLLFSGMNYKKAPAETVKRALGWETMRVDGDRNGYFVEFSHGNHMKLPHVGCTRCHHLSIPGDRATPCHQCHRHMEGTTSIFDHERHAEYYKTKGKYCDECHEGARAREHAKKCDLCHAGYDREVEYYLSARDYKSAMHDRCIPCHRAEDVRLGEIMYSDCGFCHIKLPVQ